MDIGERARRLMLLGLWGGESAFKFNPSLATFTAGMAKRNSAAPFGAGC